jgi:hypothetical protein
MHPVDDTNSTVYLNWFMHPVARYNCQLLRNRRYYYLQSTVYFNLLNLAVNIRIFRHSISFFHYL